MRVKSRKPLAACAKSSAASGRAASSATQREREQVRQVRDRGEDAVVRSRRRARRRARRRPPTARDTRRDRRAVGLRQRRQDRRCGRRTASANAAAAPVCSVPAIGCAGHEPRQRWRRSAARAAAITSCFVLPASVTIVARPQLPADRREQRRRTARPASRRARRRHRRARASSRRRASMARVDDAARARGSRFARRAADADDLVAPRPAALSASANEPPIEADADRRRAWQSGARLPSRSMRVNRVSGRARARAHRGSARFSAGRPTVTRSHSGRP